MSDTLIFYKQPVYKQVSVRSQIAKQLLGLNLFSLRNNKTCKLELLEKF